MSAKTWKSCKLSPRDEIRSGPRHPVFVALRETIRACDIPRKPFVDLLTAFRQDQTTPRYSTFSDVLGYCLYSANPVGHLVLYLCGYRDAERQKLSDYTCTALQLANFWQDVAVDYGKGRIYLPLEDLDKYGVTEDDIAQRRATPAFLEMMKFEVARAREWFQMGLPLAEMVDKHLALDIELFSRGGLEILNAIERQRYDVLTAAARNLQGRASCGCWRAQPWESCCERTPATIAGRLRSLSSYRALRRQEFLLRLPGSSCSQAQCAFGRVCLHAPCR